MLIKKILFFLTIAFFLVHLIDAEAYGSGEYGKGTYNIGESNPPVTTSTGNSCTYDWQCTNWFPEECPETGQQERICVNKGTCTSTINKPNETKNCLYKGPKEPLFDIFLTLYENYKELCPGDQIKATIKLENYGKLELVDAFMTYWIVNENNTLISELKDTRAVEKEKEFDIQINLPESISKGTYRIYAQINYLPNQTAIAGESFEIKSLENCQYLPDFNYLFLIYLGAGITIIILLILIKKLQIKKRKEKKYMEIEGKINIAKQREEYFQNYLKNLKKSFKFGKITKESYIQATQKKYNEKTLFEWVDYYQNQIKNFKGQ